MGKRWACSVFRSASPLVRLLLLLTGVATCLMPELMHAQSPSRKVARVASYNASLFGSRAGEIKQRLQDGSDDQAESIAAIVQTVRPDILLVNEIDYDEGGETAKLLAERFFARGAGGREGIEYPHVLAVPSNTGIDSGLDLDGDGVRGEPNDAFGYGVYPGQYAMAIFSRYPIDREAVRTFQTYRWAELPGALRPVDPQSGEPYHDEATWQRLRLSSKNHVDAPIRIGDQTLHVLASHPTPPVFDGDEDLNGRRNHDEIRFWIDYLRGDGAEHLVDDAGKSGGLPPDESFVIVGDLNADPEAGDGRRAAIRQLLGHDRVTDPRPTSRGGAEAIDLAEAARQPGSPQYDTANFGRNGNLRVDYVLPSDDLEVVDAGVFWPTSDDPTRRWIDASDHRLVWVEVAGW